MISFLLWAVGYLGLYQTPWPIYIVTGLVDGLLFWPVFSLTFVPAGGRFMREKAAGLWYMLAVAPLEGVVLFLVPNGYRFGLLENGAAYLPGGEYKVIEESDSHWYRLGKRKFGIEWLRDEQVIGDYRVDDDEFAIAAMTDGGEYGVLARERGGSLRGYTKYPEEIADGIRGSLTRAVNAMRGAGGTQLSERSEIQTLKNYGGDSDLTNRVRMYAWLSSMGLAVITGILVFGVL